MVKRKNIDMLNGPLWNRILMFALPLAASSMLQQLFNSADAAVVGKFAGKEALAAVGSNTSLISLIINLFVGLSVGTGVLVARYIGSGDRKKVFRTVHTSITVAAISGIIIVFTGCLASGKMLKLMGSPEEVIDLADIYLKIYFLGMPFFMVYNFGAAILRGMGDTRRPLLILCATGIINVILNLFFVAVCGMSVTGVAIATLIANFLSAAMVLYFLVKEKSDIRLDFRKLMIDGSILRDVLKIGVPAGMQGVVFSISNVMIQTSINGFGADAVSGSAAAVNYEFLGYFLLSSFAQAATTFASQNLGAMQIQRSRRAIMISLWMSVAVTVIFNTLCMIFAKQCLGIYTDDMTVMEYGMIRMKYILYMQTITCVYEVLSGGMRGLGYSMVPALIPVICVCGFRIVWLYTVFRKIHTFKMLMLVYPASWILTDIFMIIAYIVVLHKLKIRFGGMAEGKEQAIR